jgi:DNA-binding CsgD family transcriptional regulator
LSGWFPLQAAAGVIAAFDDLDRSTVLDLIGRLVDKSLLVIDDDSDANEPHYRMLETIRFYALVYARAAGEIETLRDTHATWWSDWAQAHPVTAIPTHAQIAEFDQCYPNLRAALEWLGPQPERAATLVRALGSWMFMRGYADDIRLLAFPIALHMYETRHPQWAMTVGSLSASAITLGELEFLLGPVNEAFLEAERSGDFATATACLQGLAFLDQTAQRWKVLADYGARAGLDQHRFIGEMGYHSYVPEDVRVSNDALRLLVERTPRESAVVPYLLSSWANTLLILGENDQVHRCCQDAMTTLESAPRREPTALLWVLATGAAAAMYRNDASDLDEIVRLSRARPLRGVAPFWAGVWQQTIALAAHRLHGAPLDVEQMVAVATMPIPPTTWRVGYALIARELLDRGLLAPTRALCDGLAASALSATPYHRLLCTAMRASIAHSAGDTESADQDWRTVLSLAIDQGAGPFAIDALEAIGTIAAAVSPLHSARLLAAAETGRDAINYRMRFTAEQQRHDNAHELLVQTLADTELDAAVTEGSTMSLAEACAYAQRARGERRRPTLGWDSLTPTEHDVARLVAEGDTNPEIARKLFMSVNTVKTHLTHIYAKLDIDSRAELTSRVIRHSG